MNDALTDYDLLAELYEEQYRYYRDDLHFYSRLADDYGSPILELGAGSARVSSALARAGHTVVAVEPSARMIAHGQERLREGGLEHHITYLQDDMRSVQLQARFPLIIAPFNTFMHAYTLADQDATLATVQAHLLPGGRFALDLYNPNLNELNVLRRETEWAHVGGETGELFLLQTHDPDAQILETRYYLDRSDPSGVLRRQRLVLRQRYFSRFELERALLQAGFSDLRFFGGFDKQPYRRAAPHLIVVARGGA